MPLTDYQTIVDLITHVTVEDILAADGTFALPGKKKLKRKSPSIQYIVIDVTESPITARRGTKQSNIRGKNGTRR